MVSMSTRAVHKYSLLKYLLYILPAFALWFVLAIYPHIAIYPISFYKWNGLPWGKMTWVGLNNFRNFFFNPSYSRLVWKSILYVVSLVVIQTPLALLVTTLIHSMRKGGGLFSGIFFFPVILSTVVVSLTWKYMYDPNLGSINAVLSIVGLNALKTNWLELDMAPVFAVVIHVWHKIGYPMTIIFAGLTTIPDSLYDAANVDGANGIQKYFRITLPLLMPTILRILLLTIITGGLAFDYSYLLGPVSTNMFVSKVDTLAVWVYKSGNEGNMGWPAAVGVVLSIVFVLVYIIYHFVSKRTEGKIS